MNDIIAIVGNPNVGKTSLFNKLTNSHGKVGNWAGVTVDKKEGLYKGDNKIKIVDLPGVYGLSAKSTDERLVLDFLRQNHVKCYINVVDGRNLARSIRLTNLLSSYKIPTVVALNFADKMSEEERLKSKTAIENAFSVPVVEISANSGFNVDRLMKTAIYNSEVLRLDEKWYGEILNNKPQTTFKKENLSDKLDCVFTGKLTGLPVFILVMFVVYFLTLKLGGFFSGLISNFFDGAILNFKSFFESVNLPRWLVGLFADGIMMGIGSVISFLPQILILFLLLGILEQTGYMARITFLFDRIMRSIGLSGKSVVPMILSSGCTATGIMGARTVEDLDEKRRTIYLSAFIPCGAKCAVFSWFAYYFFDKNVLVAVSMYFLGIITAIISGKILCLKKKSSDYPFLLEIPDYTFVNAKELAYTVYEKSKEFLIKAGSVIFVLSVFVWILKNFGIKGYVEGRIEESFIFYLGNFIKYFFYPIGVTDWRASVSLISGIFAKEGVVETLELIGGDISSYFKSGFTVYSYMSFILLSPPCLATLVVAKKELKSGKEFFKMLAFQTLVAYVIAGIINAVGLIVNGEFRLIFMSVLIIITIVGLQLGIKNVFLSCKNCNCIGDKKCHKKT